MAGPYIYDRIKEISSTGGTGALALAGAAAGFRSFSVVGNGNACYYCAEDGTNWEVGVGTYTSSGTTLSRDTVLASSNAGALVSFPATAKNVFIPGGPASWYGTPLTPGSVLFALVNGVLGQDNANIFWDAANARLGLGTAAPAERLHVKAGHLRMENIAVPGACSAALAGAGAGNVDNGTHAYKLTFVTAAGETITGNGVTVTVANKTTNGQVSLTAVPTGTAGLVTQRKVYRTKAGGGPFYLLTTIADNTTTAYTDNTADASLGALEPVANSTAAKVAAGATTTATLQFTGGGVLIGQAWDSGGAVRNVMAFGAKKNVIPKADGAMTSGSPTLTSASGSFAAGDVGKIIAVANAGPNQIANPTTAATVAVTGGGSAGGLLAAGTYFVKYTWMSVSGETTGGTSESAQFTVAAGNVPRVTIPALPANATGAKIYLTAAGGASNSERLYAAGVTATTCDLPVDASPDHDVVPATNTTANPLVSLVKTVNSVTSVDLADNASNTVSARPFVYGNDDTAAVQAAVDAGVGTVFFPQGNFFVTQLVMKTSVWLRGVGPGSLVYQVPGYNGHAVVVSSTSQIKTGILDIAFHGNKDYQTTSNDGIHYDQTGDTSSKNHLFQNVIVQYFKGNGIYLGAGCVDCYLHDTMSLYCDGIGLHVAFNGTDNAVIGVQAGQSGLQGIKVDGANNRFTNFKSFWSGRLNTALGFGCHVTGINNEFTGCEEQDNYSHGWHLDGATAAAMINCTSDSNHGDCFRLNNTTDSVIRGQVLTSPRADQTSVVNLTGGSLRNTVSISFYAAAVAPGAAYVQGTSAGNYVQVGPDGGYQTPAFPSVLTWTVVTATDVVTTSAAHGLGVGDPVYLSTSSALPASTPQVVINTPYYVKTVPSTTTMTLAATPGGAVIDFTGTGTGTQSMQLPLLTDPYSGNTYKLTLTANVGVAAPVFAHQGQRLSFEFTQDATGSRAVTWENVFLLRNWTVLSRPSQVSSIDFVYDGTNWVQHGGITDALLSSTMGVTTTSVSSTTTAETKSLIGTVSGSFTCMPGFMTVGRKLRLKLSGVITTGATAGTITFQVKFAGTVIASTGAVAPTISQTNKYWEAEIDVVCRTTGPTGTLFVQGKVSLMNAATPAAMVTWPVRGNSADPPAAVTVDTTATSLVDFQSITSNALHTLTANLAALEVLN
jgi:hypothetical protein